MSNSRWSMMLGILPLVSALGGLSGCYQQSTADEETGVASPRLEEAEAPKGARGDRMRGGKHGPGMGMGPGFLLGAALSELDLSDAQRATSAATSRRTARPWRPPCEAGRSTRPRSARPPLRASAITAAW